MVEVNESLPPDGDLDHWRVFVFMLAPGSDFLWPLVILEIPVSTPWPWACSSLASSFSPTGDRGRRFRWFDPGVLLGLCWLAGYILPVPAAKGQGDPSDLFGSLSTLDPWP